MKCDEAEKSKLSKFTYGHASDQTRRARHAEEKRLKYCYIASLRNTEAMVTVAQDSRDEDTISVSLT